MMAVEKFGVASPIFGGTHNASHPYVAQIACEDRSKEEVGIQELGSMVPAAEQSDDVHLVLRGENDLADGEVEVLRQISPPPAHDNGGGTTPRASKRGAVEMKKKPNATPRTTAAGRCRMRCARRRHPLTAHGHGSGQQRARTAASAASAASSAAAASPEQSSGTIGGSCQTSGGGHEGQVGEEEKIGGTIILLFLNA